MGNAVTMTNCEIIMSSNRNRIPYELQQFQMTMSLNMFLYKIIVQQRTLANEYANGIYSGLHGMDIKYFNHLISSWVGGRVGGWLCDKALSVPTPTYIPHEGERSQNPAMRLRLLPSQQLNSYRQTVLPIKITNANMNWACVPLRYSVHPGHARAAQ
jgi:hypothetical protein